MSRFCTRIASDSLFFGFLSICSAHDLFPWAFCFFSIFLLGFRAFTPATLLVYLAFSLFLLVSLFLLRTIFLGSSSFVDFQRFFIFLWAFSSILPRLIFLPYVSFFHVFCLSSFCARIASDSLFSGFLSNCYACDLFAWAFCIFCSKPFS